MENKARNEAHEKLRNAARVNRLFQLGHIDAEEAALLCEPPRSSTAPWWMLALVTFVIGFVLGEMRGASIARTACGDDSADVLDGGVHGHL